MFTEEKAREALEVYKEKTGKTQSQIAKEMGISDGQLSAFLSGSYKTPHTVIPKVEQLVNITVRKEIAPREPGFQKTTVSGIVMDLISYCHIQRKIGVAYGDAGIGKTMGIRAYQEQNPDTAIVVTISPCFATMTGVNELIAEELRIREKISRKIQTEAIKKLRGSNKVIIIDEAQHLTVRVINHLRCIADESGIGMAFVGNEEIYLKMRGSGQASYAQLYSRIADNKHILTSHITKADIELIFGESAIENDAIEILFKISRTNYGLRGAVNVFVNTAAVFGEVTAKGIARMAKEMNIA